MKMREIVKNPIFIFAILTKIIIIFFIDIAVLPGNFFLPFLSNFIDNISLNSWKTWIDNQGSIMAFPYGYVAIIYFSPFVALAKFLNLDLVISYKISLFFLDFFLLLLLNKLFIKNLNYINIIYFLSPISIIAIYILGLNDILAVFILFVSLILVSKNYFFWAGFILCMSISAKFSMIVSIPFFVIYFYKNKNLNSFLYNFLNGILLSFVIFIAPTLFYNESILMIYQNPEIEKIFQFNYKITDQTSLYFIPLIYILLLYYTWTLRRINFDLLISNTGISFLLIVIFTTPSPGWLVWCLPFLIYFKAKKEKLLLIIVNFFILFFCINFYLSDYSYFANINIKLPGFLDEDQIKKIQSIFHTFYVGSGLILVFVCWRNNVLRNNFYILFKRPFTIGIAGDSAVGKDRVANSLIDLLGEKTVTHLSGDNYHLWNRGEKFWKNATHLNPIANNLEKFSQDLTNILKEKNILTTFYNHDTGKIEKNYKLKTNDFIIYSGLHALYTPSLQQYADLKIFIEVDEELRKYFKISRDTVLRKYTKVKVLKNLKKRKEDSIKYILPQKNNADLIIRLELNKKLTYSKINSKTLSSYLSLKLISRIEIDYNSLKNFLINKSVLKYYDNFYENGYHSFSTTGKLSSQKIKYITKKMCPQVFELLKINPVWKSDLDGIIQLMILLHINKIMEKKFI